jgi:hypothetical protein
MKLAIMQPYIFPYIGYFQLLNYVDRFVLYDNVNFINKGWINRNNILINKQAGLFTIPLKKASQNKLINEIEILDDGKWKAKFLKTVELSYKKSPYFTETFSLIKEIVLIEENNLSKFIHSSLILITQYLNINTSINNSSSAVKKSQLKAQDRIIEICKDIKATNYVNPIGGINLYDKANFEAENIKLNFIKSEDFEYQQYNHSFVNHLSIIDVLMFNSLEEVNILLNKFKLL